MATEVVGLTYVENNQLQNETYTAEVFPNSKRVTEYNGIVFNAEKADIEIIIKGLYFTKILADAKPEISIGDKSYYIINAEPVSGSGQSVTIFMGAYKYE